MGSVHHVSNNDVSPISCTPYRITGTFRTDSAPLYGKDRNNQHEKAYMGVSLHYICSLECNHDILGLQRNIRRRSVRHLRQCFSDVCNIRTFPTEQKEIFRSSSIYIPDGRMDSMGAILLRRRDIMAMAGHGKLIRTVNMGNTMV